MGEQLCHRWTVYPSRDISQCDGVGRGRLAVCGDSRRHIPHRAGQLLKRLHTGICSASWACAPTAGTAAAVGAYFARWTATATLTHTTATLTVAPATRSTATYTIASASLPLFAPTATL